MSSEKPTIVENDQFVERFIEFCGSNKPSEIAQRFGISYQAVKNYLDGRLPDTSVLINISRNTSYSIHWLLTGEGAKFIGERQEAETTIGSGELRAFIRNECERVLAELLSDQVQNVKGKVIVLNAKDIKEEKVLEKSNPISLNQT